VLVRGAFGKESERCHDALADAGPVHPAALGGDAQRGQAEAGRSDAGNPAMRFIRGRAVGPRAIQHEAGLRVGLLPEIAEGATGQVFQQSLVGCRQLA
jgi:hypothetical protein